MVPASAQGLAAAVQRAIAKSGNVAQRVADRAALLHAGDSDSAPLGLAKACARLAVQLHGEDRAGAAIERVRALAGDALAVSASSYRHAERAVPHVLGAVSRSIPSTAAAASAPALAIEPPVKRFARGLAAIEAAVRGIPAE